MTGIVNSCCCTIVCAVMMLTAPMCHGTPSLEPPPGQKKIVFILKTPDLPKGTVGALPKTMYLAGEHYARIEQPADLTSGKQNLLIVRGRDLWVIDTLKRTGTHSINSSPDFTVHNPILGPHSPAELFNLNMAARLRSSLRHRLPSSARGK